MRISISHFLGPELPCSSLSATLEQEQDLGGLTAQLNHMIDCQAAAQQAFDEPTIMLKRYAEIALDESWYLTRYSDVAAAGMNAQFHFVEYGRSERRFPNDLAEKIDAASTYVDSEWYLREYPDVALSGVDAQDHFRVYGRSEGRFANLLAKRKLGLAEHVDHEWYLSRYLDVAQSGLDSVEHYIRYGQEEGRFPNAVSEINSRHPKEEFGEFLSSIYRHILSRKVGYFEFLGWFGWYKLGFSRCEIRTVIETWSRLP